MNQHLHSTPTREAALTDKRDHGPQPRRSTPTARKCLRKRARGHARRLSALRLPTELSNNELAHTRARQGRHAPARGAQRPVPHEAQLCGPRKLLASRGGSRRSQPWSTVRPGLLPCNGGWIMITTVCSSSRAMAGDSRSVKRTCVPPTACVCASVCACVCSRFATARPNRH